MLLSSRKRSAVSAIDITHTTKATSSTTTQVTIRSYDPPTSRQSTTLPVLKRRRSQGRSLISDPDMPPLEIEEEERQATPSKRSRCGSPITDQSPSTSSSLVIHLPSSCSWFDFDSISTIEKQSLPEFFNRKEEEDQYSQYYHHDDESTDQLLIPPSLFHPPLSPQSYLSIRNGLIIESHSFPSRYLNGTTARKAYQGSASSILRVHSFLDDWGIINQRFKKHKQQEREEQETE